MTILREEEGQDVPKPLQKFRSEYGHGEKEGRDGEGCDAVDPEGEFSVGDVTWWTRHQITAAKKRMRKRTKKRTVTMIAEKRIP
jgi:hypothetical protein